MCGDHASKHYLKRLVGGSPPHVRGPQKQEGVTKLFVRITPACAGTTLRRYQTELDDRDHPRMCGDHWLCKLDNLLILGSPPHVRGPLLSLLEQDGMIGITPACAGTTYSAT